MEDIEMKSAETDLTVGAPGKVILQFSVPLLFTFLLQQFYNMVDTIVVGQFLGKEALAGVGSTGAINFMIIGFCMGLANGFVIPIAQRYGAGDYRDMRKFAANSIWMTALFGLVITVSVCFLCRQILTVMETPSDILDLAYDYIIIIFAGIPVTLAYNLLTGMIRSLGDSRSPLIFLLLASVVNIGFDILSVTVLHMGVKGPACATLCAQAFSAVLCLWCIRKRFPILKMEKDEWRLESKHVGILCKMGIPMGLQYSITAIGSVILQTGINSLGSAAVASVSAASKLSMFLACPFDALGSCMATYTGQNVGARRLERIGQGLKAAVRIGMIYAVLVFIVMLFTAKYCMLLFVRASETAIINDAVRFILTNSGFYVALVIVNTFRFTIQGAGFSGFAILAGVMEMVARAVIGVVMVPYLGFSSVCFASPLAWIMADIFLIPAYCNVMKKLREHRYGFLKNV